MSVEVAEKVKHALAGGASLAQITIGRPVGGGKRNRNLIITSPKIVKRYRRENPDFDRFIIGAIADTVQPQPSAPVITLQDAINLVLKIKESEV